MKKNYASVKKIAIWFTLGYLHVFIGSAQNTYHWAPVTTNWQTATNWLPSRTTPAADDILVFDNGLTNIVINVPNEIIGKLQVTSNTSITLQAAAASTILTINGGSGDDLTVDQGSALNVFGDNNDLSLSVGTGATGLITGSMNFSASTINTAHKLLGADAGSIIFNSPAVFTQGFRCNGNIFGNTGTANVVVFKNGTTFIQNGGAIANANPFGLTAPSSKVVFNTGSLYKHKQAVGPSMTGRTYADFELDFASANIPATGVAAVNIDNLTVTAGILNLNLTGGVNLKKNILVATGGTLNFTPASNATLSFIGTTGQTINNSGTLTFSPNEAVLFNNAAGVTINSNVTFNNLVTFTNGVVAVPNPNVLTLSASATVTGSSKLSYVDGKVQKIGNTDFVFPVGKIRINGAAPIGISNFAAMPATTAFTAEYKRSSAELLGPISTGIDHVSRADYWTLDNSGTGSPVVNVTLFWTNESSYGGSVNYISALNDLVIAHFNGTSWDNFGGLGTYGSGTTTTGSITWSGVSTFSPFSLASITFANPLPISIHYFNGVKENNTHILKWKVNCVNNTATNILVERSGDNINFTTIETIKATPLLCEQEFVYTDVTPLAEINYYRLKIIDQNGKINYSEIVALQKSGFADVKLTPNVINSNTILRFFSSQKTKLSMVITAVTGQQVWQNNYAILKGNNQLEMNLYHLKPGIYQLIGYTAEGTFFKVSFIKQ